MLSIFFLIDCYFNICVANETNMVTLSYHGSWWTKSNRIIFNTATW